MTIGLRNQGLVSCTDSKGRLTTLTDKAGVSKFYYDELGQTIKTEKTIDSTTYTTETTYDALGRTKTLKYPDNSIVNYTYDTGGNLDQVIDNATGNPYATYLNYNVLGQVGQIVFGNGISTTYTYYDSYHETNRLKKIETSETLTGDLINLEYVYDDVGNISNITDNLDSSKSRSYVYDDLDRLIEADSPSYGGKLIYQYDKIGNMTYNCRYGYYFYEGGKPHAVTRINSNGQDVDNYLYDLNGNMTSGAGRTLTYDYDNMPETITYGGTAVVNVYDAGGQRVKKVTPTSTTTYIGQGYECDQNGNCTKYIFAGSNRIAKIDSADTYFYHTDHLGSSSVMTNSAGVTEQDVYYYPYGEIKTNTGSDIAKHKFTGQEWDAEYGLYYYGARYYDPKLARFISADTIVPEPFNPQALNRYSYVLNNPIIYTDPTGHGWLSDLWDDVKDVIKPIIAVVAAVVAVAIIGPAAIGLVQGLVGCAAYCTAAAYYGSAVVGGAIGGAAAGAASTAVMGGDIGQGALIGAISGGMAGFVGSIGISNSYVNGMTQIGSGGVSGGIASEISGGKFSDGFIIGAIAAGAAASAKYLYNKVVGFDLTAEKGGVAVSKRRLALPVKGKINIGTANLKLNPNGLINEGGYVSRLLNHIPGANAVSGLHDVFQVRLDQWGGNIARSALNVPGMIPATAITYSGFMTGPNAAILIPAYQKD